MTRAGTRTVVAAALLLAAGGAAGAQGVGTRIELPKPIPLPSLPKPLALPKLDTAIPGLSFVTQSQTSTQLPADTWAVNNGLVLPQTGVGWGSHAYHYGTVPSLLPSAYYGFPLQRVFQPDFTVVVATYGLAPATPRYVVGVDARTGWARYSFDLRGMGGARITWVQSVGSVLYVSYVQPGLLNSGGLVAFDTATGQILWNSASQIANASSFVVLGNRIVTGWGGSTGPGYLYVLDRATGTVVARQTLDAAPVYIAPSGSGGVAVRSRSKEYRFRIR